jgi:hypothetical protein
MTSERTILITGAGGSSPSSCFRVRMRVHCTCLSFFQLTPACKSAISDLSRTFCGSKLVAGEGKRGLKSQKMAPQVGLEPTTLRLTAGTNPYSG